MNIELKILDKEFYYRKLVNSSNGHLQTDHNIEICALPSYTTKGSAGMDLYATKDYVVAPQERVKIGTGIAIHIGNKYSWRDISDIRVAGFILPRSGLGTKGLVLANTIGVIDEDYQGEVIISAWNSLSEINSMEYDKYSGGYIRKRDIVIQAGDRIAQLILLPVIKAQFTVVDEFSEQTGRGQGGMGSTGR